MRGLSQEGSGVSSIIVYSGDVTVL